MNLNPQPDRKTGSLLRNVSVFFTIFTVWTAGVLNVEAADIQPEGRKIAKEKKETVRNRLWLWSHLAGSYNGQYSLEGKSTLSPEAAAEFLGIKNICMVRYAGKPVPSDFSNQMQSFKKLNAVVWSVVGDGQHQAGRRTRRFKGGS